MLFQHGVRHLLLADDRNSNAGAQLVPLLDAYHPFPSQPGRENPPTIDPTPAQTIVSVKAGQAVAFGSLDRSIRLHQIQIKVQKDESADQLHQNSTWIDVSINPVLESSARSSASVPERISQHTTAVSATPRSNETLLTKPCSSRRFHLPFFRHGQVYERPLIRHLVLHSDAISIYGDPEDALHVKVSNAISKCGLSEAFNFIHRYIAPISDIDGDGRLSLVLAQLADPVLPNSDEEPIRGCVRPADFQPGRETSADVIYLDPKQLQLADLQSLLAHEMAHAATFSLLVKSGQSPTAMPGWLNEAIAHYIEEQITPNSQNLQVRRREFVTRPGDFPSIIPDEITGMQLRRGPVRIASLELLKSALAHQRPTILKRLVTEQGDGVARLKSVSGEGLSSLFRRFALHLIDQQAATSPDSNAVEAAFQLNVSSDTTLNLRGTAVAISSPAKTECQLTITTTQDAMLQITVADITKSE